jgi:hypothetical protein
MSVIGSASIVLTVSRILYIYSLFLVKQYHEECIPTMFDSWLLFPPGKPASGPTCLLPKKSIRNEDRTRDLVRVRHA